MRDPENGGNVLKDKCRAMRAAGSRRQRVAGADPLCHARIITDPNKLAELYAAAEKRNRLLEVRAFGGREPIVPGA